MKSRHITEEALAAFARQLVEEEKSKNTVEKYLRDAAAFMRYAKGGEIDKNTVIAFKQKLVGDGYAARSVNAMLASLNSLFLFLGWHDCKVRSLRIQRQMFCSEAKELTREEYFRLCHAAQKKHNRRLELILQTLCGTGIRVSELRFLSVEAAEKGMTVISLKGKTRTVFLVRKLQKKLLRYAAERKITSGAIFITRGGKCVDRSNIWREMKSLCEEADVDPQKVFPHNLRHLFARVFYQKERDIAGLADVLGHSSINTTRIYIVSTGFEHRRKMETMHLIL